MTDAHSTSGSYGVVKVDDLLEQHRTGLFLKKELALAIASGRDRSSCVQKLADAGKPREE